MGHRALRRQIEALDLLAGIHSSKGPEREHPGGDGDSIVCRYDARAGASRAVRQSQVSRGCETRKPTIAERARESMFTRLVEILTELIAAERDLLGATTEQRDLLRQKDSTDLKNICWRMTLSGTGSQSDRNLRELSSCLKDIVNNLLTSIRHDSDFSSVTASLRLGEISAAFPDI